MSGACAPPRAPQSGCGPDGKERTMPCDHCTSYHQYGYDQCPACHPETPITATVTPQELLLDVADQMARRLTEGGPVPAYAVAVWLALVNRARACLTSSTQEGRR